jgi:glycogen(starch) synthase
LINEATILLVPSRQETFGLVALEAALMERPVVATRVGGLPEIVVHEQTGLLIDHDDAVGLAGRISFLLDHPDAAVRIGRAARSRTEAVFGWQHHVDAYEALYQKLTKGFALHCARSRPSARA